MTASASVVEAGRALVDALRAYGFPVSGGARASLTDGGSNEAYALNEAAVAFSDALNTPHPAEQDAREAVQWGWRVRSKPGKFAGDRPWHWQADEPTGITAENCEYEPVYAALTQAAPDGWRLVPVEPTEAMIEAGYQPWLNRGSRKGPSVLRGVFLAMISASPAPPAQGAGG